MDNSAAKRIFLLSPANIAGVRAGFLMRENGKSELAQSLRGEGAPLGEVFSFMSSLYFRAKLEYARTFACAPQNCEGVMVITAAAGLVSPTTVVTLERLREISTGNVDAREERYRLPLERHAHDLRNRAGHRCEIVLLGSIATAKYVDPLLAIFGRQLVFPEEFVGRGDMSRGGLMLRCVQDGRQLTYVPVQEARRRGPRPAKLGPKPTNR